MGFGGFIKSGLKGLRTAAPIIGAGIGAVVGGPAGAKAGASIGSAAKKATSGIGKSASAGGQQVAIPSSAHSLDAARLQDKSRLRKQYPGLGD